MGSEKDQEGCPSSEASAEVETVREERDRYREALDEQVVWTQREEARAITAEAALSQARADIVALHEAGFAPEGDARCGTRHKPTGATCLLRCGHDGPHRNTQGFWSALPQFNDPPAPPPAGGCGLDVTGLCPTPDVCDDPLSYGCPAPPPADKVREWLDEANAHLSETVGSLVLEIEHPGLGKHVAAARASVARALLALDALEANRG